MRILRYFVPVFLTIMLAIASCESFDRASDEPKIEFKSFRMFEKDTFNFTIKTGELIFTFIDGDADFGVIPYQGLDDTLNLFLIPFQKVEGMYDSLDIETYGRKYTVLNDPNLVRTGQNKTVKGEIKLQVYYFLTPPFDTIRYDFYIVDRAGHKSNIATTSDITFN